MRKKVRLAALLGTALGLLMFGCGADPADDSMDTGRAHMSDGGASWVMYTPETDPIPRAADFAITVRVHASDRSTLLMDSAVDSMTATMPAMGHGMPTDDEVTITDNGDGTHTVEPMNFVMLGHWHMEMEISNAGVQDTVSFDVMLE